MVLLFAVGGEKCKDEKHKDNEQRADGENVTESIVGRIGNSGLIGIGEGDVHVRGTCRGEKSVAEKKCVGIKTVNEAFHMAAS